MTTTPTKREETLGQAACKTATINGSRYALSTSNCDRYFCGLSITVDIYLFKNIRSVSNFQQKSIDFLIHTVFRVHGNIHAIKHIAN